MQGVKTKKYQDISCFYNTAGRDASTSENVKLFLSEPLVMERFWYPDLLRGYRNFFYSFEFI